MSMQMSLPNGTVVPNHVVIIPDGNRRWARARGLSPIEGHKAGAMALKELMRASRRLGIHTSTFWGLSTENWRERDKKEVDWLIKIIGGLIDENVAEAKKDGVKIVHLGRKDRLPLPLLEKIARAERETQGNDKHIFNLALDYGGQDEIVRAVQRIVKEGKNASEIDIKLLDNYMDTAGQPYPYPDLIIRTSGEQRTSGVLLWQSSYAETYWADCHFPDFNTLKLKEAVLDFSRRRRRFGGNDTAEHFQFDPQVLARLELKWWRLGKVPEGVGFMHFAASQLKEQYGLSKHLAKDAAKLLFEAIVEENRNKLDRAKNKLKKFYGIIKKDVKLAFEPEIAASLEIRMRSEGGEGEETTKEYLAEVYRISLFQAAKAAHLRVLAAVERNLAQAGLGEEHWAKAEDYLQKYYSALKERVA